MQSLCDILLRTIDSRAAGCYNAENFKGRLAALRKGSPISGQNRHFMSIMEANNAYKLAHKKALKRYQNDVKRGADPYPKILD